MSTASQAFLKEHGKLTFHKKGTYYKIAGIPMSTWCFIIDGLVAKEAIQADTTIRIERICGKNEYFTGTNHPYSDTPTALAIKFLQPTVLFEINNSDFKRALLYIQNSMLYSTSSNSTKSIGCRELYTFSSIPPYIESTNYLGVCQIL